MQQTAPGQPRLDYAPPPPPRWTPRRVSRLLAAVLLLLAAGAAVRQYGPRVLGQVKMLYHQRQCLRYEAPPDQVVYDEDPAAVEAMAGRDGYNMIPDPSRGRLASAQAYVPTCWQRFHAESGATLFLHERHAGAGGTGPARVVAVERPPGGWLPFGHPLDLQVSVIAPVGLTGTPSDCQPPYELKRLLRTLRTSGFPIYIQGPPVRFYAGQVDPADLSHFTIRYAIGGQSGTVDGWLQADDTVRIQIRDGPAKDSAWNQVVP